MPSSEPTQTGSPAHDLAADGFVAMAGRVTLGPHLARAAEHLDARFRSWAAEQGADEFRFPTLLPVDALDRLDYFRNFPHLGVLVSRLHADHLDDFAAGRSVDGGFAPPVTDGSDHVLQPAACYHAYLHNEGERFDGSRFVTTLGECFRNEHEYTGLTRLWGFHLREIICIGDAEEAKGHLARSKDLIASLAAELGVDLTIERAVDPFFDASSERLLMQQLFPSKEEFVTPDGVAIASVNYHRNFFGERCDIQRLDGSPAFTSCVGFGVERWLHALLAVNDGDPEAVERVCAAADPRQTSTG